MWRGGWTARLDKEAVIFEKLQNGSTTVQLLGLDPAPIEMGDGARGVREALAQ